MEDLIHVIYVGAAAPEISEHDTAEFLKEARKANRKHDVSGMMLYVGGCLLLLLEGEAHKVDAAFQEIVAAKREMRAILLEPVAEREFPDWIMGFEAVAPAEAARLLVQRYGQRCSDVLDLDRPRAHLRVQVFLQRPVALEDASERVQGEILGVLKTAKTKPLPRVARLFAVTDAPAEIFIDYVPQRHARCVIPGDAVS